MSIGNPYSAPSAPVVDRQAALVIPDDVSRKIRNAWITCCVSGSLTLLASIAAMAGARIGNASAWMLIDVVLIFGLAFGIYKKSRVCAIAMVIYFVGSKILLNTQAGNFGGVIVGFIFIYFLLQGVSGTLSYDRLKRESASAS